MKDKIRGTTTLGEIVERHPKAAEVLMRHGLHCIGCCVSGMETLEQGALAHGIKGRQLGSLLKELNKVA